MVRNVSSAVSVNEALELALTACKTCKTAQSNSLNNFVQKKTKEQTNTLQWKVQQKPAHDVNIKQEMAMAFVFSTIPIS